MNPALLVTLAALGAVLVVGLGIALGVLLSSRRRLEQALVSSREDLVALQQQVEQLAAAVEGPTTTSGQEDLAPGHEYLITDLPAGRQPGSDAAEHPGAAGPGAGAGVSRREFASLAVSESVIRVAAVASGVRRALSAENRNRIRFEVRREVRRSRKQRRLELRQTRRHLRAQDAA